MHNIHAIIGRFNDLDARGELVFPSSLIALPHGMGLIPVHDDFYRAKCAGNDAPTVIDTFEFLTAEFLAWLTLASKETRLCYCETDYFGGAGGQGAVVFDNGACIFGPEFRQDGPINHALSVMGIESSDNSGDGFQMLDLGKYRSSEQWLESVGTL